MRMRLGTSGLALGRLAFASCAAAALAGSAELPPRPGAGWIHEAGAREVPSLHPGFGPAVSANGMGLVAMSSARDTDLGSDAAMVAIRALRRGRFEPAGLAHHPHHRHDSGFGSCLAIDDDGTLFVGAPEAGGGTVFVFERPSGFRWDEPADMMWDLVAEIQSPSPQPGARFGAAISVAGHGQGRLLVVGEPDRDVRALPGIAGFRAGAAHVFERRGSSWSHAATLHSPEPGTTARFGSAVAVADGIALIGAPGASREVDGRHAWSCGDAWCAERVDGQWRVMQRLHPPRVHALAAFGAAVGFDGTTMAVAALREPLRRDATGPGVPRRGAVHLYERSRSGWPTDPASRMAPWRPVQRILPATEDDEHFAACLSIRDGMLAVGAPAAQARAGLDALDAERDAARTIACGASYVFEKVHANTWVMRSRCIAPDAMEGARDGAGVSLTRRSDGCPGLVMTRGGDPEAPPGPGAVHAFTSAQMAIGAVPAQWVAGTA